VRSMFCAGPATAALSTLSLHDALPIYIGVHVMMLGYQQVLHHAHLFEQTHMLEGAYHTLACQLEAGHAADFLAAKADAAGTGLRSEEHTSELQSRENLVCRLLLEKNKP